MQKLVCTHVFWDKTVVYCNYPNPNSGPNPNQTLIIALAQSPSTFGKLHRLTIACNMDITVRK